MDDDSPAAGSGGARGTLDKDALVAVGVAIRKLRTERELSLRALSASCGLSVSFLSMVERGQSSLALTSLQRIASALGTSIPELFEAELPEVEPRMKLHVQRQEEPHEIAITAARRTYVLLSGRSTERVLEPMLIVSPVRR